MNFKVQKLAESALVRIRSFTQSLATDAVDVISMNSWEQSQTVKPHLNKTRLLFIGNPVDPADAWSAERVAEWQLLLICESMCKEYV